MEEHDIDCTGTEDEVIAREADKAASRFWPDSGAKWDHIVGPLVRIILALVAALGAKSVREALARAKALLAPVDVEKEVERVANAIREGREAIPDRPMTDILRPLVEDRARLAREVDGLRVSLDTSERDRANAAHGLNEARAEIESLTQGVTHHMTVSAIHRAEIARLTAELAERTTGRDIIGRWYSGARAEVIERCEEIRRLRAAAPGEALARKARAVCDDAQSHTRHPSTSLVGTILINDLRAALAAVEPRAVDAIAAEPSAAVDPAKQAYQPTVEMRLEYTATASTAQPVTVDVLAPSPEQQILQATLDVSAPDRMNNEGAEKYRRREAQTRLDELHARYPNAFGEALESMHKPAPEMAVTTGDVERAPDACEHGTLFSWPCADCEREMAVTTGEPPPPKTPPFDPICACGEPLSRHDAAGQYDPCPGGGGQFRDPPAGVPSIAGPAGLDLASGPPPAAQCVAVLVEDHDDRVLLVLSSKGADRAWELPGGKIDPGEDPRAAARREVIEETGLAVVLSEDEPVVLPATERHRGALLFRGRAEGEPRPGSDAIEARWISRGEVMRLYRGGRLSNLASCARLLAWAGAQ